VEPIDLLMGEHRHIERVLGALGDAIERARAGEGLSVSGFEAAVRFIRGFADGLHHLKEEDVLFAAMAEHGMPPDQGPLAVMLHEHQVGREHVTRMDGAVNALRSGLEVGVPPLLQGAQGYAELLALHIHKEDRILYPLSRQLLPAAAFEKIAARFAKIDGAHSVPFAEATEQAVSALGSKGDLFPTRP